MEREFTLNKYKLITVFMIALALISAPTLFLPHVEAFNVGMITIFPSDHTVHVGEEVRIIGTINTTNGVYRIWLQGNPSNLTINQKVNETTAIGNNVNVTFICPALPRYNYTTIIQDVAANLNATTWLLIDYRYGIEAKPPTPPRQMQEGDSVDIWVNLTAGDRNTVYWANVTIKTPKNQTYSTLAQLTNATDNGMCTNTTIKYPNSFLGKPNTNYTGTYTVSFSFYNKTSNTTAVATLATDTFTVGLTNFTEYHRFQNVNVKALGYKPGENVTVKVLFGTDALQKENVAADLGGIVTANWAVPSNASIGTYAVNINSTSPSPTKKAPPDTQNFAVPGFDVNITTRNLAGEPVPNLVVEVKENNKSIQNTTGSSIGLVPLKLEIGNYTFNASFRNKKVGQRDLTVTNRTSEYITCNLTNLKIRVAAIVGGLEIGVPEVKIYLTPENQTLKTDINGTVIAHSLLPNATRPYVLNASRYDMPFRNVTTIPTLLVNGIAIAWFNKTIICPTLRLQVNVTNANGQPIAQARIRVRELIGGLFNESWTDSVGKAVFSFIFGKYIIGIYDTDGIKLNETSVDLFQNQNVSIPCVLSGLNISVKIIDYLGQPMSNANVTLQREGATSRSAMTQSDGTVTFNTITGGNLQMTVYLHDQTQPCVETGFFADKSTAMNIKIEKYVLLAGMLVETSQLATVLIIASTLILVLALEIYRRRRVKSKETES
jgi:hypothetical protein